MSTPDVPVLPEGTHSKEGLGSDAFLKLLVVQLLAADGASPDGEPVLAVDALGAGKGSKVIVTSDGKATREFLKSDTTPVRWSVIGIQD